MWILGAAGWLRWRGAQLPPEARLDDADDDADDADELGVVPVAEESDPEGESAQVSPSRPPSVV